MPNKQDVTPATAGQAPRELPRTAQWPDLSAYGLELVLAADPVRGRVLAIRAVTGFDPPPASGEIAGDRYATKLMRLGFERSRSIWTRPFSRFVPGRFVSHLPLVKVTPRAWEEIVVL